jgi:hypothetical protein
MRYATRRTTLAGPPTRRCKSFCRWVIFTLGQMLERGEESFGSPPHKVGVMSLSGVK